jgi:hypothetical protein
MSTIAREHLPQNRPLWEIHIIKYPTKNAAGTLVFKLHHALGDGYSLMGALLSCLERADNPSLPFTLPSSQRPKTNFNISSVSFSMNCIKEVKSRLRVVCEISLLKFFFCDDMMISLIN